MAGCHGNVSFRVILVIFGGFLIHLALGAMYTIGNFSPYIISYIRNRTDDATIRNVDSLWIISIGAIGNCIGLTIGGLNAHRFGAKIATLIGSIIYCGATATNYFSVQKSFIALVSTYGLVGFIGHKLTYGTPVQTAIKWLPNHATLAAGLIVSGTGGGSLIFNQIVTGYVNPDNLSPDFIDDDDERYFTQDEVLDKVPTCFLILGACYFGLQLIGIACISEPTIKPAQVTSKEFEQNVSASDAKIEDKAKPTRTKVNGIDNKAFTDINIDSEELPNKISDEIEPTNHDKALDSDPQTELGILEAVKVALTSRSFYIIWLTILLINAGMQFITGLYKAYGQTFINDDHFLALVGSIAAIFNCIGRPIWGGVMDKLGFRVAIRLVSGGFAVCTGTLLFTEQLPRALFMVWICALFFFFCGIWSMMPSVLSKLLGPQHMAINYGLIYTGVNVYSYGVLYELGSLYPIFQAIANILGSTLGSTLKTSIGWHGLFFMASGMGCAVFISSFAFNGIDRSGKRI